MQYIHPVDVKRLAQLDQVSNTSDLQKVQSGPVQSALAGKADLQHTHVVADLSNATATGQVFLTTNSQDTRRQAVGLPMKPLLVDGSRPYAYVAYSDRIERLDYTQAGAPVVLHYNTTQAQFIWHQRTNLPYA